MSVPPRKWKDGTVSTRSARSSALLELDREDAARARALDAEAELQLFALDGAHEAVARHLHASLPGKGPRTRGPAQEAMRKAAAEIGQPRLFAAADEIYWKMVARHEKMATAQAAEHARKSRVGVDVVLSVVLLGWFRAALRFDPGRDNTFVHYARAWGTAAWQRANDRQADIDGFSGKRRGDWGRVHGCSLDAPRGEGSDATLMDTLAADPGETSLEERVDMTRIEGVLDRLDARARAVLVGRAHGRSFSEIGAEMGLSRERVRQLEIRGLARARLLLLGPVEIEAGMDEIDPVEPVAREIARPVKTSEARAGKAIDAPVDIPPLARVQRGLLAAARLPGPVHPSWTLAISPPLHPVLQRARAMGILAPPGDMARLFQEKLCWESDEVEAARPALEVALARYPGASAASLAAMTRARVFIVEAWMAGTGESAVRRAEFYFSSGKAIDKSTREIALEVYASPAHVEEGRRRWLAASNVMAEGKNRRGNRRIMDEFDLTGKPAGRPPLPVSDSTLERAQAAIAAGMTLEQAARSVGLSKSTLARRLSARDGQSYHGDTASKGDILDEAGARLAEAARIRRRATELRAEAVALDDQAEALARQARDILDRALGPSP